MAGGDARPTGVSGDRERERDCLGYSDEAITGGMLYTPGDSVVVRAQATHMDGALTFEAEGLVVNGDRYPESVRVAVITLPDKVAGMAGREFGLDVLNDMAELMQLTEFDRLTGMALRVPASWPYVRIGVPKKGSVA